jgi:hypothetical protein
MEIININGKDESPDPSKDFTEFATEISAVMRGHPHLDPSRVGWFFFSLASDIHHSMVAAVQQAQVAQAMVAREAADRIKRGGLN